MILRLSLILLLSLPLGSSVAQTNRSSKLSALAEKQKAAEEAADRVMSSFYETLDFKPIFDDLYVRDPLRTTEVRWTIRGIVWQSTAASQPQTLPKTLSIDFAAMERAYIARENFEFLSSAVRFTHDEREESKFKTEFEQMYHEYYESAAAQGLKPILTSERLDDAFTANLNRLNDLLRKYVVAKNFGTSGYKDRVSSVQESRDEESSRMNKLFELKPEQRIFVVRRENHYLYFIEDSGQIRMLSITPRIMD